MAAQQKINVFMLALEKVQVVVPQVSFEFFIKIGKTDTLIRRRIPYANTAI